MTASKDAPPPSPALQSREYLQAPSGHFEYVTLITCTTGDPAAIANDIKSTIAPDKDVPISEIETMDQAVENSNPQPRFELWLLASIAAVAVLPRT